MEEKRDKEVAQTKIPEIPDSEVKGTKCHVDPTTGTTILTNESGATVRIPMAEATVQVGAVADRSIGFVSYIDGFTSWYQRWSYSSTPATAAGLLSKDSTVAIGTNGRIYSRPRGNGSFRTVTTVGQLRGAGSKIGGVFTAANVGYDLFRGDYTGQERLGAVGYDLLGLTPPGAVLNLSVTAIQLFYPGGTNGLDADVGYAITGRY